MPVIEQNMDVGILYLENRSLSRAFTRERIQILKMLSAQAAISIRNALNYDKLSKTKNELEKSAATSDPNFDNCSDNLGYCSPCSQV